MATYTNVFRGMSSMILIRHDVMLLQSLGEMTGAPDAKFGIHP